MSKLIIEILNNAENLFKFNNDDSQVCYLYWTYFTACFSVNIVDFEHIIDLKDLRKNI